MATETHKWLDFAQHLSYYISGGFVVLITAGKMFWNQHRSKERRIDNLEVLAESAEARLDLITKQLDLNHEEHKVIVATMQKQHDDTMNTIVSLHTK